MEQAVKDTIMVVGDDSNFCYLMRRFVRQSSHQVAFAYRGEDALAIARRETPSAIVIEVDMPDSAGWYVLKALRADEVTCKIPVVLCSWNDEEYQPADQKAEVYLRKPVLYENFLEALNQIGIVADLK